MKRVNLLGIAGLVLGFATMAFAQAPAAPAVELKVGDKAPNFKLQGSDGKTYSLADFAGKKAVVIAWFPAAFTKGCTVECKSLAMNGDKIRQLQRRVFHGEHRPDRKEHRFCESAGSRLSAVERSDSRRSRSAYGVLNAKGTATPLDVLHRHRRPNPCHRQGHQGRYVGRGYGRKARRVERRQDEI